jgi:hypothetical protein
MSDEGNEAMTYSNDEHVAYADDLPSAIFRHWIHSREEDAGDLEVYRPEGFAFPPSFGRDGFEMRKDGIFVLDVIGDADGVEKVLGRWTSAGSRGVSVCFDDPGRPGFSFEVVDVADDILRIRREAQQTGPDKYISQPGMDEAQMETFRASPPPSSSRLIDFEEAKVLSFQNFPSKLALRVRGTKPYANMQVDLVPVVYVRQPEYWMIEVVGSLRGIGIPALAPYEVFISLSGITGTRGIEVVGATRSEQIDLIPCDPTEA